MEIMRLELRKWWKRKDGIHVSIAIGYLDMISVCEIVFISESRMHLCS
jgi:hypothetical protein